MKGVAKEITLLSRGIFEKPFMDSKVKTRSVSTKERILGHLVGPLGLCIGVDWTWTGYDELGPEEKPAWLNLSAGVLMEHVMTATEQLLD